MGDDTLVEIDNPTAADLAVTAFSLLDGTRDRRVAETVRPSAVDVAKVAAILVSPGLQDAIAMGRQLGHWRWALDEAQFAIAEAERQLSEAGE